jgi:hypothetical protein
VTEALKLEEGETEAEEYESPNPRATSEVAAGQPALFAREYSSSSASLYAREYPTASAAESL